MPLGHRNSLKTKAQEVVAHFLCYVEKFSSVLVFEHRVMLLRLADQVVHIAVGRKQVFPAIVVVVDESVAPSRMGSADNQHLCGGRNILKRISPPVCGQKPEYCHPNCFV